MKEKEILSSLKNTIENAPIDLLDRIKEQPGTKMIRHDDITRQNSIYATARKLIPFASVAAVFLAIFLNWQFTAIAMDSRIYLDVNPSITIETNRQDKAIELIAGNEDGEKLIEGIDYKGKSIYLVTEMVLERMIEQGFIEDPGEFLLLSVYNKNREKAELQKVTLDEFIHGYLEDKSITPIVLIQNIENTATIEKYAAEYRVSVSMMTFMRNMIILDPNLKIEQMAGLSLSELVKMSQGMGLDLERIIETKDIEKIRPITEPIIDSDDDEIHNDEIDDDEIDDNEIDDDEKDDDEVVDDEIDDDEIDDDEKDDDEVVDDEIDDDEIDDYETDEDEIDEDEIDDDEIDDDETDEDEIDDDEIDD